MRPIVQLGLQILLLSYYIKNSLTAEEKEEEEAEEAKDVKPWWKNDNSLSAPDNIFKAYDCSRPVDIHRVGSFAEVFCNDVSNGHIKKEVDRGYQLLQREHNLRFQGWRCQSKWSRKAWQCGAAEHDTTFAAATIHDQIETIHNQYCEAWVNNKYFVDSNGVEHPLALGSTTSIQYLEKGKDYIFSGDAIHAQQVSCQGGDFPWKDKILKDMMVQITKEITITAETFVSNLETYELFAHTSDLRLECHKNDRSCMTQQGTFVWRNPGDPCPLAVANEVKGKEVTDDAGNHVFMSTDESLTRLIRGDTVGMCGRIVYSTNYKNLYLYPLNAKDQFARKLEQGEYSTITYVKNRDETLYHTIKDKVQEEYEYILRTGCKHRQMEIKLLHWLRHKDPEVMTWLLGNGTFATAAGEVLYQYRCLPVIVKAVAVPDDRCYQALPVTGAGGSNNHPLFSAATFMEPLTHRLTHQGVPVPCSKQFTADFMNANGVWIRTYPHLHTVSPPEVLLQDTEGTVTRPIKWDDIDWSKGGIYTDEDLEKMEQYQDFSRTVTAITSTIRGQMSPHYVPGEIITPGMIFHEFATPESPYQRFSKAMKKFFHVFGETASIFVTIFLFSRGIMALGTWLFSFQKLRQIYGIGGGIARTLFFDCFLAQAFRESDQGQREKEKRDRANEIVVRAREEQRRQLLKLRSEEGYDCTVSIVNDTDSGVTTLNDNTPLGDMKNASAPMKNDYTSLFPNLKDIK